MGSLLHPGPLLPFPDSGSYLSSRRHTHTHTHSHVRVYVYTLLPQLLVLRPVSLQHRIVPCTVIRSDDPSSPHIDYKPVTLYRFLFLCGNSTVDKLMIHANVSLEGRKVFIRDAYDKLWRRIRIARRL